MDKQIEELMKPRYKVIADYPQSIWRIGLNVPDFPIEYLEKNFKPYPHLFRELKWWEERTESEMPEYVKLPDWHDETIFCYFKIGDEYKYDKELDRVVHKSGGGTLIHYFLPATESEYLNYINNGKK